ncbi:MAG: hypothetical protein AAEJ52_09085 [Myxococcota bacterium]
MARPGGGIFQRGAGFTGYTIGRSFPCRGCRYDLRGLTLDTRCPECGKPVADTFDPWIKGEEADTDMAVLRQGLRLATASWMIYLALELACLSPIVALALMLLGPIMRLFAIRSFATSNDALSGEWPISLPILGAMALGSLILTVVFIITLIAAPGMTSSIVSILFFIAIAAEGFIWITALAKYASQLQFPLIGPVARIARWCWLLLPAAGVLLFLANSVFSSNGLIQMIGQIVLVFGIAICALLSAGVTTTFSDIARQFAMMRDDEGTEDPFLVALQGSSPAGTGIPDDTPLGVAESSGEKIRIKESTIEFREQKDKPRDDRHDPNNPTGVY